MLYYILKYHWVLWLILLLMIFPPTKEDLWFVLFAIVLGIIIIIAQRLEVMIQKRLAASEIDDETNIHSDRPEVGDNHEEDGEVVDLEK